MVTDENSLVDLSCLLCAVCKSVFTDCRDKLTMYYYISYLDMVTIAQTKWKPDFSVIYKKYSSFNYDFLLKYIFGRR